MNLTPSMISVTIIFVKLLQRIWGFVLVLQCVSLSVFSLPVVVCIFQKYAFQMIMELCHIHLILVRHGIPVTKGVGLAKGRGIRGWYEISARRHLNLKGEAKNIFLGGPKFRKQWNLRMELGSLRTPWENSPYHLILNPNIYPIKNKFKPFTHIVHGNLGIIFYFRNENWWHFPRSKVFHWNIFKHFLSMILKWSTKSWVIILYIR